MLRAHDLVTSSVPNYFASLPVPKTFGGLFHLGPKNTLRLLFPLVIAAGLGYAVVRLFAPRGGSGIVNVLRISAGTPKVVHAVNLEVECPPGKKVSYCRCWRSAKFPYCDGAHNAHNKETGDNVGPLSINRQ